LSILFSSIPCIGGKEECWRLAAGAVGAVVRWGGAAAGPGED